MNNMKRSMGSAFADLEVKENLEDKNAERRVLDLLALCPDPKTVGELMVADLHLGGSLGNMSHERVFLTCQKLFEQDLVDLAIHNGEMVVYLQVPTLTDMVTDQMHPAQKQALNNKKTEPSL